MPTIEENLTTLAQIKADIKTSIINKGVDAGDDITLYGDKIRNISGGSGAVPNYLCITSVSSDGTDISLSNFGENEPNIEYSFDSTNWTLWDYYNIHINEGQNVFFRGNNADGFNVNSDQYSTFVISGDANLSGNVTTLEAHNGVRECKPWSFRNLFKNATAIIDASKLKFPAVVNVRGLTNFFAGCSNLVYGPTMEEVEEIICDETTIGYNLYAMFQNCSSMIMGPTILKPTTVGYGSYSALFDGCASLVFAPYIKATSIANGGAYIFRNCSNLQYIKADLLGVGSGKTTNWVSGVASTGCFIKNKNATWTTKSASACPSGWTLITSAS